MADSSIITLGTARSLLVDVSVCDSRMVDHTFLDMACDDMEDMLPRVETRVVLVGDAGKNEALVKALQDINKTCLKTDNVREFGDGENAEFETVFVLKDFDTPDYSYLYKNDNRIVGPPVVLYCAGREEPLPFSSRPLYSTTMLNLSLCFTGFRNKEEVKNLVNLVHHMGGTIRKDFSTKVSHLIAYSTHGEKYKLAVCMGTPILTPAWIHKAWERRDEVTFHAGDEAFRTEFKVPPFQDCVLSFLGFSEEDKTNMEERTLKHGGLHLEVGDEKCTHMVVEENSVKELPFAPAKKLYVVKQEWFWGSIQMDARAGESMYSYERTDSPTMKKAVSLLSLNTPNSNRKRRRLRDTLAQLTKETDISPFPPRKRPSAEHSMSMGSLLDFSNTPDTCKALAEASVGSGRRRRGGGMEERRSRRTRERRSRTDRQGDCSFQRTSTPQPASALPSPQQHTPFRESSLREPGPGLQTSSPCPDQPHPETLSPSPHQSLTESTPIFSLQQYHPLCPSPCQAHTRQADPRESPFSSKQLPQPADTEATSRTVDSISQEAVRLRESLNKSESSRPSKSSTPAPGKQSARWHVSKELYQTESNYVGILSTVLQLFKIPLEKEGQVGGPILAPEEMKTIFGSIPEIYDVHTRIKADLEELVMDWSEDKSVGDIILKYSKDLVKAYPPFVNFFEMSKETIVRCEKQKPRFHAFLKINQSKPECGRQTLVELLIRPVQRLPSVALLLNDIKKHTSDDNPDKVTLERAIESLREVMTHINEDKRKTEGQKQIFDVVYEVDGCPANLLSSHRSLVHRVETIALGDKPCDRGENVTLFLFNDCLEIARKRHKVISTFRSPLGQTRPPAHLKHITLMPLSQIRRVLDLQDTEDCQNAFALVVHPPTEQENLLFSFQLSGEDTVKTAWLKMLCRHIANTICKADAEDLIQNTEPDSVQVSTKDMDSTLSKASRAIKKTSKKVTRAFSFTKTPKRVIQRAFMASSTPDERSPRLGSHNMGRMGSSSTLAMARSSSTFNLSDSDASLSAGASVQRSNSLDQPPRPRASVRIRTTPCSPAPAGPPAPGPVTGLHPRSAPPPSSPEPISSHPRVRFHPGDKYRDALVPCDPRKGGPRSPRKETLL
ncbi:protein ECT2 isoform X2 [Osmerus eperlanus]|uniref:protein ECT2 isoform X2 n=1 Tax=Osmerus eperlanus TaxID=29151 RepID=UPI002E0DDF14